MPELPEVETTKIFLSRKIIGRKIKKIETFSAKQFIGDPELVKGLKITDIQRRAKILIWQLEKDLSFLIHLKLTGQIVYSDSLEKDRAVFGHPIPFAGGNSLPGKTTRIIIYLNKGAIFFNDLRKFGWIKIAKSEELKAKSLGKLGVEPLSKEFTSEKLRQILQKTRRPVKLVLIDQTKIAGIGNIYANDALYEAGIDPRKPANQVTKTDELHKAIIKVLTEGIKYGGASAADEAYIKPDSTKGKYQDHFKVYQQTGKICPRCQKEKIQRINLAGRGTFFCPECQK